MSSDPSRSPAPGVPAGAVVIRQRSAGWRVVAWLLMVLLVLSVLANVAMYSAYSAYFASASGPTEKFHSGEEAATDKLAIIRVAGTIMPPFTERIIKSIKKAKNDERVKGVLLSVNSPGGLVTDSHQIYHELKQLAAEKPIVVSMGGVAASGGYYIAMGAGDSGRVFAEPTTWTGSIGVIIPHYEVTGLAEKVGLTADPLKTGEFKDSLSPFRPLTERDRELWDNIINQAFEQFLTVIDENRAGLDMTQVRALATGQIYTARDAKQNGLIDEIGFEEDALAALKGAAGVTRARIVEYDHPAGLLDLLLASAQANDPAAQWRAMLDVTVPRAMYLFSWAPFPLH